MELLQVQLYCSKLEAVCRSQQLGQTKEKPCVCWIACINLYRSFSFVLYCGRSNRLKQVWATGKYLSSKDGWIKIWKRTEFLTVIWRTSTKISTVVLAVSYYVALWVHVLATMIVFAEVIITPPSSQLVCTPPTAQSNQFQLFHDSGR